MTKKQLLQEWEKLNFEMFKNKPVAKGPYPDSIVKRRELLLYAQVHLSEIEWAKKCKSLEMERLHTEKYYHVMQMYYAFEN